MKKGKFVITEEDDSFEKAVEKLTLPENAKIFRDKFVKLYNKRLQDRKKNRRPLLQSIKAFLIKQRLIDIKINLLVVKIVIKIPSEHDWIHLVFSLLGIVRLDVSACYGAGWAIGLYKEYIAFHLGRCIIYFTWWSNNPFVDIKTDWMMSRMTYDQMVRMKGVFNEIEDKIK